MLLLLLLPRARAEPGSHPRGSVYGNRAAPPGGPQTSRRGHEPRLRLESSPWRADGEGRRRSGTRPGAVWWAHPFALPPISCPGATSWPPRSPVGTCAPEKVREPSHFPSRCREAGPRSLEGSRLGVRSFLLGGHTYTSKSPSRARKMLPVAVSTTSKHSHAFNFLGTRRSYVFYGFWHVGCKGLVLIERWKGESRNISTLWGKIPPCCYRLNVPSTSLIS